jgi:cellulase/cellobiase CelA1
VWVFLVQIANGEIIGDWCNVISKLFPIPKPNIRISLLTYIAETGFGIRPTSNTGHASVDAIVWAKPGGESDGTSDTTAARYDTHCGLPDALKPAPEAGKWFQAYFEQLLTNASPSFM